MADNRLKVKAMNNYWQSLGFYAPNADKIESSPENNETIKHQEPNPRKKFVQVGKARIRIRGL